MIDVKLLRIVTGEEVIAELIEENASSITVQNGLVVLPTNNGVGFAPWATVISKEDPEITISKTHVVYVADFENIVENCPDHEVVVMIYNIKGCGAQERAERLGIPNCRIKSIDEQKIIDKLNRHKVDLVVLAGWMRIVTPGLINAFPNKIINIHPSLLPKYKGLNAVKQALDSGDKITGCTVHYVTEELDSGGCIDSSSVLICAGDTEETLHHRVQRAEHRLLPMVINNLFENIN
jgi:phosphoribosylglycinamide formyltransferase-1